jgi:hypothetical protein
MLAGKAREMGLGLIQSGKVELIGKPNGSDTYETLPASELRNLSDIPVCDYFFGWSDDTSGLVCCYCPDDEDWEQGLNDRLFASRWSRLQVRIEQTQHAPQDQEIRADERDPEAQARERQELLEVAASKGAEAGGKKAAEVAQETIERAIAKLLPERRPRPSRNFSVSL